MSIEMGKSVPTAVSTEQIAPKIENRSLPVPCPAEIFWSAVGSFLGIGIVSFLAVHHQLPLLATSFGSSAVLLYAACNAPMAQPRNVLGGHVVSALAGVFIFQLCGAEWWSYALAVSLAIAGMQLTKTMHPPGGATAFVAVYNQQEFSFVFTPIALGAALLVLVALLVNNLAKNRKYPEQWW
ncbi:MAG: HPP family protein [Firmicutes bacterium]|nr:HPP family protein [Bacillota bacterium]